MTTTSLKEHDFNINMLLEGGNNHVCVILYCTVAEIIPKCDFLMLGHAFSLVLRQKYPFYDDGNAYNEYLINRYIKFTYKYSLHTN